MSIKAEQLRAAHALMQEPRDFEIGELVTWKDMSLKNCLIPELQDFGICVRFEEPVRGSSEPAINQFSDWKDVVLGFIADDGEYCEYAFNSKRLKKFVE